MVDQLNFQVADVIFDSWDIVKRIPDYDVVIGGMMFQKIFETAPSTLNIFSFGSRFACKKEELYNSRTFELHSKAVVKMLEDVLSMIMPDLVPMKRTLKALGARHISYGVRPFHLNLITEVLLSALESILGDTAWTPKVEEGWKTAIGFISKTMISGANKQLKKKRREAQQSPSLEELSSKSDHSKTSCSSWSTQQSIETPEAAPVFKSNVCGRRVSFDMSKGFVKDGDDATLSTSGSDSMLDHWQESDVNYMKYVEAVYTSWDTIKKVPNYSEVAGTLLFQNIFEASEETKQLFSFAKSQTNDQGLSKNIGFLIHAKGVIDMLDTCVGMMGPDMEPVSKALEELGARHCQYDMVDAHYPILGEALLKTLETTLGDAWTPELKESWAGIYAFISNAMQNGARGFLEESLSAHGEI